MSLLGTLLLAPDAAAATDDTATEHDYVIRGVVRHPTGRQPIEGALVILQCSCLQEARETMTNSAGMYRFKHLPAGTYTVQVLSGTADVSKVVRLGKRRDR
ncbi:MAG: carboxypeptidase-like regulatory domain-containing protein [Myxococcota bacterium]